MGGSHLQRLQRWQADVDFNRPSFQVCRTGRLFTEALTIFCPSFLMAQVSRLGLPAAPGWQPPQEVKTPGKMCSRGIFEDVAACQNKDPGKSGLFILLEMESSRYLSNAFIGWDCSVAKSCPALCHPVNCSTPGSCVLHYLQSLLLRFTSTESVMLYNHFTLPPSFTLNLCQHQGLF